MVKKIYRRVYTGKVTAYNQDLFTVEDQIDALVDIKGYIKMNTNYILPINFTQQNSSQAAVFLKPDLKTVAFRGAYDVNNGDFYITLEYTKK